MRTVDDVLTMPGLPALDGPERRAERLVMLAHRGVNWDVWGGARHTGYWDALTERVKAATYAGPTLADWWEDIGRHLDTAPRNPADRKAVATEIAGGDDRAVLTALHKHASALVLRVRVRVEQLRTTPDEETR